jgi:hypothetical protein
MNQNTHKAFAVISLVAGVAACAAVLFLQSGGLIETTPHPPSALQTAAVVSSASAVDLPNSFEHAPPPPPKLPTSLAMDEITIVGSLPKSVRRSKAHGVARPYANSCYKRDNVTICDPKEHQRPSDRREIGSLVEDYREDFLRLLEE